MSGSTGRDEHPDGTVELWQQEDGQWRWRWVSPDGRSTLIAHRAFDTAAQAVESARAAYPEAGVPGPETPTPRRHRWRRAGVVGLVVGMTAVGAVCVLRRRATAVTRRRTAPRSRRAWGLPQG